MRGIKVCALLLSSSPVKGTMNFFFESLSMPPNSHTLLSCRPLISYNKNGFIYFHDNTITTDRLLIVKPVQRVFRTEAPPAYTCVFGPLRHSMIVLWSHTFCNQWLQNKTTCHTGSYIPSKKVPLKSDTVKLHCLIRFLGGNFLYLLQYYWCFSNLS